MKYVYKFQEGNKEMKMLLGGKGANLAEMTNLGLPVPSGFTITTDACKNYYENNNEVSSEIVNEVLDNMKTMEINSGKTFGKGENPLLISVRSGAPASMPGMMDTILNLGMNDEVAKTMIQKTNNKRFVYDSYRRLIMMFADVVKGYDRSVFDNRLEEYKQKKNVTKDIDLDENDLFSLTEDYKKIYESFEGKPFPQDAVTQLLEAVSAVFRSWNNDRAIYYRKMNDIPGDWGTAVNIQEMVFGNIGETSGTGVAFTRNPATGENLLYGEYLMNAQGEDVVAGIRTPQKISELESTMPNIYQEFLGYAKKLENHYKDMQDMEFTIENGTLYLLQTRNGKRTPEAALKIAVDMVANGEITKEEALLKIEPKSLDNILHPSFQSAALNNAKLIGKGLAASPGAAVGEICFSKEEVIEEVAKGNDCILVRNETSPEDIEGMNHAKGILTIRGGMTSHAAVVARGMGRPCVCGCEKAVVNEENHTVTFEDGTVLKKGEIISLNGATGFVYEGSIPVDETGHNENLATIMAWADEVKQIGVKANADSEKDALVAKELGAHGIGLCRTEHMFFDTDRIFAFRKMILASTETERVNALNEILPYQKDDFTKLFRVTSPYSVTIRLLDPPLHEFLPKTEKEIEELATGLSITVEKIKERIEYLKEFNPMMGHRGCRLDVTYPEIAVMQTRAIIESALTIQKEGLKIVPEIMIPLVGDVKEFEFVKSIIDETANNIMKETNTTIEYRVGTMIEIPRACTQADIIANKAEFFSFGTNDLTQLTYGFSRDDAAKFLNDYYNRKIMDSDPFASIDEFGVGALMKMAIDKAKSVNPNISLGICGEHAADPKSIAFCYKLGLDYVSCSPYRIPVAKLAAAQSTLKK